VKLPAAVIALALAVPARAEPIDPAGVRVLDGDTIEAQGMVYRLVGFDAPETGRRAQRASEHEKGELAKARLVKLVAGGGLDLERVVCSCRPGAERTPACNDGRLCGTLRARGRDVGAILISEGLARRYVCGPRSCPARTAWCE
jgi:endonuclease YncB( thermonuclease family)